jgi:uncharacterized phage protein (TIGR01671 family)
MTPLRFRAWDKWDEKMYYLGIDAELEVHIQATTNYLIFSVGNHLCESMQSTGLLDKNGKEIFCSDILVVRDLHDSNVFDNVWNQKEQKPIPQVIKQLSPIKWDIPSDISYHPEWWEIIGTIYENPELLQ